MIQRNEMVTKDYYELNYHGSFTISSIKELDDFVILKDILKKRVVEGVPDIEDFETVEDEEIEEPKFYQLDVTIKTEYQTRKTFIIETTDINKGLIIIKDYIIKCDKNKTLPPDFEIKLEAAKQIPCDTIIDYEFSKAYVND